MNSSSTATVVGLAPPEDPGEGVVDRLLWRDAQHVLGTHRRADAAGRCVACGQVWPCPARQAALQAVRVATSAAPATGTSPAVDLWAGVA